jgi:hypothetical protein
VATAARPSIFAARALSSTPAVLSVAAGIVHPEPLEEAIETLVAVSEAVRFVAAEAVEEKLIVSPVATPAPVTAAESVTVVEVTEATVVPEGTTPDVVASDTDIPTAMEDGTEEKVSVLPEEVAALVFRLTLALNPGSVDQPPLALKNLFAKASPAAGAGTRPVVPPEPVSPVKTVVAAGMLSSGQGETVAADVVRTSL